MCSPLHLAGAFTGKAKWSATSSARCTSAPWTSLKRRSATRCSSTSRRRERNKKQGNHMSNVTALATKNQGFSLTPQSLDEAMKFADIIAKSDIVPPDYKGKPGNVLVA